MAGGEAGVTLGQTHLSRQDLTTLDVTKLTLISHKVISRQPTINIGAVGYVAPGKSTVVKAIPGVHTVQKWTRRKYYSQVGSANVRICELDEPSRPWPERYRSCGSSALTRFLQTRGNFMWVRVWLSCVCCPGLAISMAVCWPGRRDGCISSVDSYREPCPQPQTSEYLAAVEIMKLKHILIVQNKIDLVIESQAKEQYD